jgi:hypothetical protein
MAFKPNYRQERAARGRAKDQKKQEKLLRQQENVAKRKAALEEPAPSSGDEAPNPND